MTVDVPQMPVGCAITLTFWAYAPQPCFTNRAQATYTSLPGSGTPINDTHSVTPCPPLNPIPGDCERVYYASGQKTNAGPACDHDPLTGMVAWWPLDEPNGATVVNDLALFNNQGVPKPGSPLGSTNAPDAVNGEVGGALSFNINPHHNPHIEVSDHPEINFGTGDFSIDAWVFVPMPNFPTLVAYTHPIVDKLVYSASTTGNTGYAWYLVSESATSAHLQLDMGDGGSLANYLGPIATSILFDKWTHIAVTVSRSPATVTFYVNGSPLPAINLPVPGSSIGNTLPLLIGRSRLPGANQAAITLDELEMFNRVLQLGEVKKIFAAGACGKCKCLLATNETITYNQNGTFNYQFTLTNLSSSPVTEVNFQPPNGVTITPSSITIPLLAGSSTTVTVTISGPGAVSGATVCFNVGLVWPPGAAGCLVQQCITLPYCLASACEPSPPGMVAWWPLNETDKKIKLP